jgi:4-alpha-glucanotransferase
VEATHKKANRSAGILFHPTSLPGPYGIGDIGPTAHAWVDGMRAAKQTWWQVLPLGPTGFGDSPYQCFSAFAGNPNLVSPDLLIEENLLRPDDLPVNDFPTHTVDYGRVVELKARLCSRAWENFQSAAAPALRPAFEAFCVRNTGWLEDFALFMALKDAHGGASWLQWPAEYRMREPAALKSARRQLAIRIGEHRFRQFLFFHQWDHLKRHANSQGLRLIGDVPIFVSSDSADVWANPDLFLLDEERRPSAVAGVPPDYFSQTGQLWGNPLYDWEALKETDYAWWIDRIRAGLGQVDLIRLDHFRGFEAYWEIPAGMPTAEIGEWVKGPGAALFEALREALGDLPLIAEDLGVITPEVEALRAQFDLPGMRVLQFAFLGGLEERFLPHNYERNTVVYTGTHDNDTTQGWYNALAPHERDFLHRYMPPTDQGAVWDLIRLAWSSVADIALAPFQDVLGCDTEARMNRPGQSSGNWAWRITEEDLKHSALDRLREMTETYRR